MDTQAFENPTSKPGKRKAPMKPVYGPGEADPDQPEGPLPLSYSQSVLGPIPSDSGAFQESSPSPLPDSIPASTLPSSTSQALSALCKEYKRIGKKMAELKKDQDEIKESIEELALNIPAKKIIGEGWSTTRQCKTSREINNELLMLESSKRGYDPITVREIITASTEEKKGKEYVTVSGSK